MSTARIQETIKNDVVDLQSPPVISIIDDIPIEISEYIFNMLDSISATKLLRINHRISNIIKPLIPSIIEQEAKRQFELFEKHLKSDLTTRKDVINHLCYFNNYAKKYYSTNHCKASQQRKLALMILQLLDCMTFLTSENIIEFRYYGGNKQILIPHWKQYAFFWRELDYTNEPIMLSLKRDKLNTIIEAFKHTFDNVTNSDITQNEAESTVKMHFLQDHVDLIHHLRINSTPTYAESVNLFTSKNKHDIRIKIFDLLDQAINNITKLNYELQHNAEMPEITCAIL